MPTTYTDTDADRVLETEHRALWACGWHHLLLRHPGQGLGEGAGGGAGGG